MVVYNKESGAFEYIGEPILLNYEKEVTDLEEMMSCIKNWLSKNARITPRSIFEACDKYGSGEVADSQFFADCMLKMGIRLRLGEQDLLRQVLDPRVLKFLCYKPFVDELTELPQLEFRQKEIVKLAKMVEQRDLTREQFKTLVDPNRKESLDFNSFGIALHSTRSENFTITDEEVSLIFKFVSKSIRTTGVTASIEKLTIYTFEALHALALSRLADSAKRALSPLQDYFTKHDKDMDGFLSFTELESLFLEDL